MYKVVVRKSLRYADGTTALEESYEEVNHQRHALNLAAKIARSDVVESVEIEEVRGRFKARAARTSQGTVHETLQSSSWRVQRETHFHSGRKNRVGKLFLLSLLGLGALGCIISYVARFPQSRNNAPTSGNHSVLIGDFRVMAVALGSPSADLIRRFGVKPRSGFQLVMVIINVRNISQSENCLEFKPLLLVKSGNKRLLPGIKALLGPQAYSLLPQESGDGRYVFEVMNGAEPVMQELVPKSAAEYTCQQAKTSGRRSSLVNKVDLPLQELPKPSEN